MMSLFSGQMTGQYVFTLFLTGIFLAGNFSTIKAQYRINPTATQEQQLARAEAHLQGFRNDSAIVITGQLLRELKVRGQFDTPTGIRAQFIQAATYQVNTQNDMALPRLLRVEQLSRANGHWEIHARTCLLLALLYEEEGFRERSRQKLDLTRADIDQHRLGSVYPRYAVRMSSWQRANDKDSALFFAREAIRTAPGHELVYEEAEGYFLVSVLLPKSRINEQLQHALTATRLYRKAGSQIRTAEMFTVVAHLYSRAKNFPLALAYTDSSIVGANQIIAAGKKVRGLWDKGKAYRLRGSIYQETGLLDSALVNTTRSYELALDVKEIEAKSQINEIDSRYQTRLQQKQITEQQFALRLKDNQLRFSLSIGGLILMLALGLAISYRKQQQDKRQVLKQNTLIQQQTTQLQQHDAAKSRFFANVSHELRTPLTLLLGPIGTLLTENHLTDKQADLLQLAHRNGQQLRQLVTDLLDLGKLELGKLELHEKPTPVAAFFRSHATQFASLAGSRHLHYAVGIDVADAVVANLDQAKCRQVLNNLLANAIKFTPAGGRVTVSLILTNNSLHLRVADTGPGIHPDDRPHLFDRYFQTTRPDKPAEGGTGIGLALCREHTHLMGGTINVDSTPGVGSVFQVIVPIRVSPAEVAALALEHQVLRSLTAPTGQPPVQAPANRPVAVSPATAGATILVVEDNPDLQAYLLLILSDKYRVVTAENGKVALECLRTDGPDSISLILSDIMMPVMDGHQLLEALKADDATRHIPVIMLTARADVRDKLRALRIGVDDYLLKPFEEVELVARIDNLLANQTARQQVQATGESTPGPAQPVLSQDDQMWLETLEHYMQQHLANPLLSVPDIAHNFAMSESTLLRKLKRLTGLSPVQYIQAVRLEEARRLLESRTGLSIAQVATSVGYDNTRSFSQSFRARFGKLPSELLDV